MTHSDFLGGLRGPNGLPMWLRSTGCAYLYWVVFLLALEPGNVLHARSMGQSLDFDTEALRISVAALLGCSTAPLIVALINRFPISGTRPWRSIVIHLVAAVTLSFVLILVSCLLVAWALQGQAVPSMADVRSQLAANWLLLTFALCAFAMISHAMKFRFPSASQPAPTSSKAIAIKTRGRLGYLDVASIEWIEAQGNYLALHVGGRSHLIRESLQSFATRIDPDRFIRVHRRAIVAVDQIRELQPLANGDSTLILQDGSTIRVSRSYRETLRKRWGR